MPTMPNLRRIRERKYLTQERLAALSKVSRPSIARLENGDVEARFSTILKLAEALEVDPDQLTQRSEDEPR